MTKVPKRWFKLFEKKSPLWNTLLQCWALLHLCHPFPVCAWSVLALNSLPRYKILHVLASCHVKKSAHERGDARPEKLNLSALCSSSSQPKLSLTSRPPFPYWRYVRSRGVPASEITWSPPPGIFQGRTLGTRSAPTDRLVARGDVNAVGGRLEASSRSGGGEDFGFVLEVWRPLVEKPAPVQRSAQQSRPVSIRTLKIVPSVHFES